MKIAGFNYDISATLGIQIGGLEQQKKALTFHRFVMRRGVAR
jgi:hypothetical protein